MPLEHTSNSNPTPLEDPAQVQRIIALVVEGDTKKLKRFSRRTGAGLDAVRKRARKLGLTPGFVRRCRLSGSRPGMRHCLLCEARFLSRGYHNRMCRRCGKKTSYA